MGKVDFHELSRANGPEGHLGNLEDVWDSYDQPREGRKEVSPGRKPGPRQAWFWLAGVDKPWGMLRIRAEPRRGDTGLLGSAALRVF
jgi:hypothetical protein